MNAYTPHEGDYRNKPDNIIADIATAPIRPSTYIWNWTHNPFAWSSKTGVWVPFSTNKEAWSKAGQAIGSSFKEGKLLKATGQTLGSAWKLGPLGGGGRMLARPSSKMMEKINSRYAKHSARAIRYGILAETSERRLNIINKRMINAQKQYNKISKTASSKSNRATIKTEFDALNEMKEKYTKRSVKYAGMSSAHKKTATGLANKKALATTGKWAMRVGKGVALVGALSLTWDIAKMVGEPLGRLAVAEAQNIADNFSSRFNPEVGGQLALSYLTKGAATERQRALMAMSKSGISGRSALGQEAKYTHQ